MSDSSETSDGVLIAVPLYGTEVSPRFGFADKVLLVDVHAGRPGHRRQVLLGRKDIPSRLNRLAELKVDVLVCGGFNRRYLPLAQRLGIRVIWGRGGSAAQALESVLQEESERLTVGKP